jgi:hypothetical protein
MNVLLYCFLCLYRFLNECPRTPVKVSLQRFSGISCMCASLSRAKEEIKKLSAAKCCVRCGKF